MSEALRSAIAELRSKVDALAKEIMGDTRIAEMRKLLAGLNGIEDLCGEPKTTLGSLLSFGDNNIAQSTSGVQVQPDEFYGLEPLVAAKKFLKKPEKAVPFDEIVAAIRSGGGEPGNEEKLRVSLARSTWDVAKIGDDLFGLLEFYPHVKRGKKKKIAVSDSTNGLSSGADVSEAEEELAGADADFGVQEDDVINPQD